MAFRIRRVDYFYTTVKDQPGEAFKLLTQLADLGLNLLAFTTVPVGPQSTQLTLFPEESAKLQKTASLAKLPLDGPHPAFLVQGDDELGALAGIHNRLFEANINVYASSGVTDGEGDFGYIVYVRADLYEKAAKALGI
jgi:hypothetical protein